MNTARAGRNAKPPLNRNRGDSGAWRPVLASLLCRNGPDPRLWDVWPKFGIPPTVAERSQQKHARPGKEFDTQSWNGGVQMKKLFLGSVALVAMGLGAPAFAADRPGPCRPPPPPAPASAST